MCYLSLIGLLRLHYTFCQIESPLLLISMKPAFMVIPKGLFFLCCRNETSSQPAYSRQSTRERPALQGQERYDFHREIPMLPVHYRSIVGIYIIIIVETFLQSSILFHSKLFSTPLFDSSMT